MQQIYDLERRIQKLENALQHLVMPSQQLEATTEKNPQDGSNTASVLMNQVAGINANVLLHQNYGHWSRPLPGALHTVINVGGQNGRGISIASQDENFRPTNLAAGDVYSGDNQGQSIWFSSGNIIINTGGNVTINGKVLNINATSSLTITSPQTTISGNLTVNQNLTVADELLVTTGPIKQAGTIVIVP
jgi:phage gp45-like